MTLFEIAKHCLFAKTLILVTYQPKPIKLKGEKRRRPYTHIAVGGEVLLLGDIFLDIYHFKLGAEAVSKRKPRKEGA